jgi:hypothetical protein
MSLVCARSCLAVSLSEVAHALGEHDGRFKLVQAHVSPFLLAQVLTPITCHPSVIDRCGVAAEQLKFRVVLPVAPP